MPNLKELREQRQADADDPGQWTQAAVAFRIGASTRSYARWESGGAGLPRPFYRKRLARIFGVTEAELGF